MCNTIGPRFETIEGAFNIALPAHEWSRYPRRWVERLNGFDQVWVTSGHVRAVLSDSGVEAPILFAPPALDMDRIPMKTGWAADGPFRFFSCGEAHFRKGFHLLMEGFTRAFPEPGEAALTIKTSPGCRWEPPREDITIVTDTMSREPMLAMYADHDVYVTASLGEGLGLPVAEAVTAMVPVAANFWGGHASLLAKGAFFEIPGEVVPQLFCSDPSYYASGQMCVYSAPEKISETLRSAARSSAEERKQMAERSREHLVGVYGAAVAGKRIGRLFGI